jgi:bifunctional non-homologous end joining protein LigD
MPHHAQKRVPSKRLNLYFDPQLEFAKLVDKVPSGTGWMHESKYDGYRILSTLQGRGVRLDSRNGLDWTERFAEIADAIKKLDVDSAVLDGEIVVLNKAGLSSFSALQSHLSGKAKKGFVYYVFDLLYLNGVDLREAPLLARKKLLRALLRSNKNSPIQFTPHQVAQGEKAFESACRDDLEGIISKRIDSPYRSGRSLDWVKTKCRHEEEFVIGGFTNPGGSRERFGALLLGYWKGSDFVYCGRVGTGFDSKMLNRIYKILKKTEISKSPFATGLSREERRGVHYVKPKYIAQIKYTEWTADQRLRHPVFLGLREDKSESEVNRAA